ARVQVKCPLWVKSGHFRMSAPCPLYPQKRTFTGAVGMSAKCHVRRRAFIKAIAGSATVWPFAARAQQPERVRRVGVLTNLAENDPEERRRIAASCNHCRNWDVATTITCGSTTAGR